MECDELVNDLGLVGQAVRAIGTIRVSANSAKPPSAVRPPPNLSNGARPTIRPGRWVIRLHEPESIEERPPLESLLERLDLAQTRDLVQELIAEQPRLIETVDDYVQRLAEPIPPP